MKRLLLLVGLLFLLTTFTPNVQPPKQGGITVPPQSTIIYQAQKKSFDTKDRYIPNKICLVNNKEGPVYYICLKYLDDKYVYPIDVNKMNSS